MDPQTLIVSVLDSGLAVDVSGSDAGKVINNLCTNNIASLEVGEACEAFITNLRGWSVAHVVVARFDDSILLVGQHDDPTYVCNHIDKYIISEDARVEDQSQDVSLLLIDSPPTNDSFSRLRTDLLGSGSAGQVQIGGVRVRAAAFAMTSDRAVILSCLAGERPKLVGALHAQGFEDWSASDLQRRRISNFWPLSGKEILEKTIPQELDRDARAISFTKGCYLGQETIARLDARGQLQKKLCLVEIASAQVQAGDTLSSGEKEVGHLTSVAEVATSGSVIGLAFLRRGNFAPGTTLQCAGSPATVLERVSK